MPIHTNSFPRKPRDLKEEMWSSVGINQDFKITDAGSGFTDENLGWMAFNNFTGPSFPEEQGYSPYLDNALFEWQNDLTPFAHSKSSAESQHIVKRLEAARDANYASPYYWLGRTLGFLTDPTSLMLWTKAGRSTIGSAKMFGSLVTAEEVAKQWLDPSRPDEFVPWTIGLGYGVPAILNKLRTGKLPPSVSAKVKKADETFNGPQTVLSKEGYEEGKLIDPNTVQKPSAAGSNVNPDAPKHISYNAEREAEQIVKTFLGKFGEDGPWTPVFRVLKSSSLQAREMITQLLDTPLLQLKNTKKYGFRSSEISIEMERKLMEKEVIEAHKLMEDLYMKYLDRLGKSLKTGSNIEMNLTQRLSQDGTMSLNQFSKEITKARLNNLNHDIPEVAEAARITQEKVYKPFLDKLNQYGVRLEPIERELRFWEDVLYRMTKKGETNTSFKHSQSGEFANWNIKQIENRIVKLKERLQRTKEHSGVKNYVNRIYIRKEIEKNKSLFIKILRESFIRNNQQGLLTRINQIADDLANDYPFIRFEKAMQDGDRYAFNNSRYARATRAREVYLDEIAQLDLIKGGFIVDDMFQLMKMYYRQVAPDIALSAKYGDANGLGWRTTAGQAGYSPGLKQVEFEYAKRIEAATSKTQKSKLISERNRVLSDLEDAIELIRGTYGLPGDPTRWWSRGMRMFKHYNALTMLTGFMSALPDPVRIIMTNGIRKTFGRALQIYSQGLNGSIVKLGKKEANAAAEAVDMITGHRAMMFSDIRDMYAIGSKAESMIGKTSHFNFMYVNMMSRWTEYWKSIGGTIIGSRILEDSLVWARGGKLSDKWKTALAASGIDANMAERIARQYKKYGTKGKNILIAQTDLWDDAKAVKHYRAAMNKDINRTIVTPTLGDTPLWMSTELGSTIAQFKKFVMAANQRMLMRSLQERDTEFLIGSLMLLGSGMMIDALYTYTRFEKDWGKKPFMDKLLSAFDRSGLGGIYYDINRAIESLSDNRIGIRPIIGANKPYSNSFKSKIGNVGGPTAGQIANIFDIIYDVGSGGYNHYTARNVRRLIPFQNIWYLDWLFDDIEKGLR